MNKLQLAWEKSFTDQRYRIGLHVIFWIVFIFLLEVVNYYTNRSIDTKWQLDVIDVIVSVVGTLIMICSVYYLTIYLSYRNIITKRRFVRGILWILVCIFIYINLFFYVELIAISFVQQLGYHLPPTIRNLMPYLNKGYIHFMTIPILLFQIIISYCFYMFFPLCCKFLRDQMRMQKNQIELQKKNIQLEMDFLKAQIHPHFLFNTLNNIYSLITNHENKKSAEMVSGLSSLLRYALYDGKTEFITLDKEVSMVKDFIGLEEVRSDDMHLDLKLPDNIPSVKIPPFLLLPLAENAFKHGAHSQLRHPCVKIEIGILENQLWMQVRNKFDPEYRNINAGGLGLTNLKKRLDYYYRENYFLETAEKEDVYTATLKLPLLCPQLNA